jgi:hypothetical protein
MCVQIFGHSLELHPVVVLMALAFWFAIWGVVGAILSIPVTAVIRIVLSHSNHPYARITIRLLEGALRPSVQACAVYAHVLLSDGPSRLLPLPSP